MSIIYYVEDDESISCVVKEYLEQQDHKVQIFSTIASAEQALRSSCPALVLVDWNMPDGSGRDLCGWIRAGWKDLPVILLTVRDDPGDIVSAFQSGADDYVVKPFELSVLSSRIRAVLGGAETFQDSICPAAKYRWIGKRCLCFARGRRSP